MIDAAILDTGPLVAFFQRNEQNHNWVVRRFQELPPKFLTCEPVLTEACFLLGFAERAIEQLEGFLSREVIEIPFQLTREREAVMRLMRTYRNIPMSLADACLVRMSELYPALPVFTLDSHFRIYRRNGREQITTIMPSKET